MRPLTEYRELQRRFLMNVIHQYSISISRDGGKMVWTSGAHIGREPQQLYNYKRRWDRRHYALPSCKLNASVHVFCVDPDMSFVSDGAEVDQIKKTFEMIFVTWDKDSTINDDGAF